MNIMVLGVGNSIIKAKISRKEQGEIAFFHAIRQLTESEYQKILARDQINGNAKDYFRVNDIPYAVGESAERHGLVKPMNGCQTFVHFGWLD